MDGADVDTLLPDDVIDQVTMCLSDTAAEKIFLANRRKWTTKKVPKDNDNKGKHGLNTSNKKRKRGAKDVKPKLRQKHCSASSKKDTETSVTCYNSDGLDPKKTQTDSMMGAIDTNSGNTSLTKNELDQNSSSDSLYFAITDCHALPIIVVETYRDKKSTQIVKGPCGKQGDPMCFSNTRKDRLSMVLSCPTTSSYIYCFSMAHKRPHFVWSEQHMESYISQAVTADSGMPQMILHSRQCLSSPITVNNTDGSLNFHMYSDQTEEFRHHFLSIETDFCWWMQNFDDLKKKNKKGKVDHGGFSESIDVGFGRHRCSESASKSQNSSKCIVCNLPGRIQREMDTKFQNIFKAFGPDDTFHGQTFS